MNKNKKLKFIKVFGFLFLFFIVFAVFDNFAEATRKGGPGSSCDSSATYSCYAPYYCNPSSGRCSYNSSVNVDSGDACGPQKPCQEGSYCMPMTGHCSTAGTDYDFCGFEGYLNDGCLDGYECTENVIRPFDPPGVRYDFPVCMPPKGPSINIPRPKCGSRSTTYASTVTNWPDDSTFCFNGNTIPNKFPSPGMTVNWRCFSKASKTGIPCSATRLKTGSSTGIVSGTVRDNNGVGIPDVKVFFCGKNGSILTDKDGKYSKKLAEKSYCSRIVSTPDGYTTINATNSRCEGLSSYEYQMVDSNKHKGCNGYTKFEKWDLASDKNLDFVISIDKPKKTIIGELVPSPVTVKIGQPSVLIASRIDGTASGIITYEFDCESDGIIDGEYKTVNTTQSHSCIYNTTGLKTAKVIMTQEKAKITPTANITVNACDPVYSYSCKNIPSCEGKCDQTVQGNCYKKDIQCGGEIEVSTSFCSGKNPPNCKETCGSCGSSNWIETEIIR